MTRSGPWPSRACGRTRAPSSSVGSLACYARIRRPACGQRPQQAWDASFWPASSTKLVAPDERRILGELLTTFHLKGESLKVRRRALESAAYAGSAEVTAALELAYDQDEEELRQSAVLGMGRTCDPRWRPILLDELESSSAAMRYEAVVACGELGLVDSVPLLGAMLHDRDPQVAEAAIWALGQIGGNVARDLLLDAYEDADEDFQAAIDEALAEQSLSAGTSAFTLQDIDDPDAVDLLYEDEEGVWGTTDEDDSAEADPQT